MMKSFVAGSVFNDAELSTKPKLGGLPKTTDFSLEERMGGRDWTSWCQELGEAASYRLDLPTISFGRSGHPPMTV